MLCDCPPGLLELREVFFLLYFFFSLLAMMDSFISSKQHDNNRESLWCSGNWAAESCSFWNNLGIMQ